MTPVESIAVGELARRVVDVLIRYRVLGLRRGNNADY